MELHIRCVYLAFATISNFWKGSSQGKSSEAAWLVPKTSHRKQVIWQWIGLCNSNGWSGLYPSSHFWAVENPCRHNCLDHYLAANTVWETGWCPQRSAVIAEEIMSIQGSYRQMHERLASRNILHLPGNDKKDTANPEVGEQDVDPDVRSHGIQEGEEAVVGGVGFAIQDTDAHAHEGLGEVNKLFTHVGYGERSHCQVGSL